MTDKNAIDYQAKVQTALRSVIQDILLQASQNGLPGSHHFYISFLTDYPGIKMSDDLLDQYPDEMTIVLQHEFWDLSVNQDSFSVSLCFDEEKETIKIPFKSITNFVDPSVKFGLQFTPTPEEQDLSSTVEKSAPSSSEKIEPGSNIISLDIFRKK